MTHELQLTTDQEDVTLALGQHPDGVLEFEGGTAAVDDESVARVIDDTYPNIEYVDGDAGAGADATSGDDQEDDDVVAEPPFDPTEKTVGELEELLDEGDYSAAELDAIAAAEEAGEDRSTAQDAIDAAASSDP
jgi:hypothetical protein